jgi:WD40 repeat protein/uncharacterized caspase-like protein
VAGIIPNLVKKYQMRFAILFILSVVYMMASGQVSKPFLVINPNGHKGQVRSLALTYDKKQVVTGSFDKTIRVWDIETGEMVREILGEIGTGSNGMIYAVALSPDDKYLAAGGWLGDHDATEAIGDIRIYDFKSGRLLYLLKGHVNVIHSLAFLPDGKRLLASDGERELILWDVPGKQIIRKYNHTDKKLKLGQDDDVMDIAVCGDMFMTADNFGRIKFWDVNRKDPVKTDFYYQEIPADGVAWSPDGNYMAAVADTFLTIYDKDYKPVAEATGDMEFIFASFSPDSKKLLLGCTGIGQKHSVSVLYLASEGWMPYCDFEDVDNSVIAGSFIDDSTYVIAGGSKDEVIVIRLKGVDEKPQELQRMSSRGKIIFAASLNENTIAYADEWTANFGMSDFNHQFDLFSKTFTIPDKNLKWTRPVTKLDDFSLVRYRRGDALNGGLRIDFKNQPFDSIPLEFWDGDQHRCFSFVKQYVVSGASYGMLRAYTLKGVEVSRFIGHIGDIEGMSLSSDGKRMITASNDRTMKIWAADAIGAKGYSNNAESVADYCIRMKVYGGFKKHFKWLGVTSESTIPTREAWMKVLDAFIDNDYVCNSFRNRFAEMFSNPIYPVASVFVDESGDWIIWNEEGYFTSSKKGSKYVGYHVNQGREKESKYFPFEQFDLKYNRPDIIMKELSMADDDVIKAYYLAYQKRLKRMGIEESQLSGDIHLPVVLVNDYKLDETKQEVMLNFSASDEKYTLDRVNVYVNDVPVYGTAGISIRGQLLQQYSSNIDIALCPGKNKIQISVLNSKGAESLKETFTVINKSSGKPDLYLISIGVSKYKDEKFNLNFAAKDAKDVVRFFEKCGLYNQVFVTELTNEQVTKEAILKLKSSFLSKAQTRDVVMMFAAGHGVLDHKMNYYFGTYDMDFMNPASGGIAYEDLEQLLDGIKPVKKLFLMDSCHSGELDSDEYTVASATTVKSGSVTFRNAGNVNAVTKNGFGLSQSAQLASELFADLRRGTGATIISSAGGAEYAMESDKWKNGLFTYCLLSGIQDMSCDVNKDGEILLSEIQNHVYNKVSELSGGKQRPTTRRENLEFDFRVW